MGDIIAVPIRKPHKFSNPFDEEAVFMNTITPGFFVRYFEHLEELIGGGTKLSPEVNVAALRRFATVRLLPEEVEKLEAEMKQIHKESKEQNKQDKQESTSIDGHRKS